MSNLQVIMKGGPEIHLLDVSHDLHSDTQLLVVNGSRELHPLREADTHFKVNKCSYWCIFAPITAFRWFIFTLLMYNFTDLKDMVTLSNKLSFMAEKQNIIVSKRATITIKKQLKRFKKKKSKSTSENIREIENWKT